MEQTHYTREKRFVKKWDGKEPQDLGIARLEIPNGEWRLDGQKLGVNTIMHLMGYALQSLTDSYAAAKDRTEAEAFFKAKRDKLYNNTIGVRSDAEPANLYETCGRIYVQQLVKAGNISTMPQAAFDAMDKTKAVEWLDKFIADHDEKLRPVIEAKVAEREAEMKRKAEQKARDAELAQSMKF